MVKPTQQAEAVAQECARVLGAPADQLLFSNLESLFPWLLSGEIIWGVNRARKSAVFWVGATSKPQWLNGADGLTFVSSLIRANAGRFPGSLPPLQLAAAARRLTIEPPGEVGCPEFLQKMTPLLVYWLKKDAPEQRALFASQCQDPRLTREPNGNWLLEFSYFNPQGGVEHWQLRGDPNRIVSLEKTAGLPDDTFLWPSA